MSHDARLARKSGNSTEEHEKARLDYGYLPIEDYGIIGNLRTSALCSMDGAIDFFCYPVFDSPSVFARLLDKDKGGHFSICPTTQTTKKQHYLPNTNMLNTKFQCEEGVGEIVDFMPRPNNSGLIKKLPLLPWLVRRVGTMRGTLTYNIECFPAFNYARDPHTTEILPATSNGGNGGTGGAYTNRVSSDDVEFSSKVCPERVVFTSANLTMDLRCVILSKEGPCPEVKWTIVDRSESGHLGPGVQCDVELNEGQEIYLILREPPHSQSQCHQVVDPVMQQTEGVPEFTFIDPPLSADLMTFLFAQTFVYWSKWIGQSTYKGRWREHVNRSALTLKLLTYEPTGAVVAAATFSLPEDIGGTRNWDYRFTWVRDSAFTLYALMRLGMTQEAHAYMGFLTKLFADRNPDGSLQIMYTIHGGKELEETELHHLDGYRGSKPVRIGNGAADHLQLDIYGELMDAIYLYNKLGTPIGYDMWCQVRELVDYVCQNWDRQDMSIWEVRSSKLNFVYSKVMCWVAIDRGIRLSEKRCLPLPQRDTWYRIRDQIYEDVMTKGWNPELRVFRQAYETDDTLDSSVLIMPLVFFISPVDPRFLNTVRQILKPPEKGGLTASNLVFRYNHLRSTDGIEGREGSFSMCTFWLVEALTRAGKYDASLLHKAHNIFENMIGYSNHLTLYSEEIARSGEALGNFPQAFTHIAMISAAYNLNRVLR
ncbi:glycoside hydrolase family 15 protein [Dimargaris cristalligena]|uniref:Glycoside hydrolase family 15 protein n=1 Tax=Dimargaris cristalligena TaxID=215637 RepID=A0A4Q0A270_9FUNG|nr:glycoside hydrolase family 15 protein [Dimargaris cristalligena]|eukprot:RKP39918.1 glycoside hydrolase family 15 protein [Dimargaris cristalligena]